MIFAFLRVFVFENKYGLFGKEWEDKKMKEYLEDKREKLRK
jgi:hypothetical protein